MVQRRTFAMEPALSFVPGRGRHRRLLADDGTGRVVPAASRDNLVADAVLVVAQTDVRQIE